MRPLLQSFRITVLLTLAILVPAAFAQAPQRPAITGISCVLFTVSDPAAAQHFYGDELGYTAVKTKLAEMAKLGAVQYFVRGDGLQYIETIPGKPFTLATGPTRLVAVGLRTSSVTQMEAYLRAKGVEISQPASNGELEVKDPEGHVILFHDASFSVFAGTQIAPSAPGAQPISHRIIHAGFVVQSAAKEDTFYRDILGFHPYWHGGFKEGVTDWSSVQVPEGTDWIEYMLNIPPDASAASRGGSNHVSLGVEHMSDAIAQLKKNGCDTKECTSPQMGRDGKVQLNLYDPDHTRVEVMEFAPSGTTCCSQYTGKMPSAKDPE